MPDPPLAAVPQPPMAAVPQPPKAAVPQPPMAAVPQPPMAAVPQPPMAGVPQPPMAAVPQPPMAAVPQPPKAAVPQPPMAAVPQPPMAAVPQPPKAAVPQPPMAAVPQPQMAAVPQPPMAAVPQPPMAAVPQPPMAAVPQPPMAAVPQPPMAAVPQPPMAAVPQPPMAAVPQPPMAAVPQPPMAAVPQPPMAAVPQPPMAAVPQPPMAAVPQPPMAAVPQPPMAAGTVQATSPLFHQGVPLPKVCLLPSQYLPSGFHPAGGAARPPELSEEQKRELERAALRELASASGDHNREPEEVVKTLAGRLFFLSRCDVATMLTNVATSVQSLGRHDVGLLANEDGTTFTFIQSPHYGTDNFAEGLQHPSRHRRAVEDAKERINRSDCRSRERFLRAARAGTPSNAEERRSPNPPKSTKRSTSMAARDFPKSTYEQIQQVLQEQRRTSRHEKRGASASRKGQRRPSSADGGYLLWRYGGKYPQECLYENYRLRGMRRRQH